MTYNVQHERRKVKREMKRTGVTRFFSLAVPDRTMPSLTTPFPTKPYPTNAIPDPVPVFQLAGKV